MSEKAITSLVTILVAIAGLAALAVLVSNNARTASVFQATSGGLAQMICTALSPIGVKCGNNLLPSVTSSITYPGL